MAITYQRFFAPQLIPAVDTTIYTVPITPTQTVMKSMRVRLSNTSIAAVAVTLYAVPSTGSAGASNNILPAVAISPNDYLDVDIPDMSAGDSLHASAGTTNVVSIAQLDGFLKN